MQKGESMAYRHSTYFGLWSARDVRKVADLLTSVGGRFQIKEFIGTEEVLRESCAWDRASSHPHSGFRLWIDSADLPIVGDKIVVMFPERKLGAL
jgi:hypothetical protein